MSVYDGRLTCKFSPSERKAIEAEAERLGTTLNYVVRIAVRKQLGMSVPDVTLVTGNEEHGTEAI